MARNSSDTLEGLLVEGQRLYAKVSDADFEDETDRDGTIHKGIETLEALQQGVSREAVFSSNEEIDDIDTPVLPLLASSYYLGSLLLRLPFTNPETRLKMLDRAEALLSEYLNTCEQLSLLEEIDRLAWQSMLKSGGKSTTGRGQAMSREQKIERFRRQKRDRQRMKEIEAELARGEAKDHQDESEDGERRRERAILLLSSLANDALEEVSGLDKEKEMLRYMLEAAERERPGTGREGVCVRRSPEVKDRGSGLEVTHISRVGGKLQIRKENVRGKVFQPTVEPPTMTVEEFGELELERARHRKAKEDGQPSTRRRYDQLELDGDEDNEELVEQAASHDRDWDNWKDENPKGSGNKANKRI